MKGTEGEKSEGDISTASRQCLSKERGSNKAGEKRDTEAVLISSQTAAYGPYKGQISPEVHMTFPQKQFHGPIFARETCAKHQGIQVSIQASREQLYVYRYQCSYGKYVCKADF